MGGTDGAASMTLAARQVLDDCRDALGDLADGVQGPTFRRRWITALALLRAVGHVLDKIDSEKSHLYRESIRNWWKRLKSTEPEPHIFWDFIDKERNMLLKEYRMQAGQGVSIQVGGIQLAFNARLVRVRSIHLERLRITTT